MVQRIILFLLILSCDLIGQANAVKLKTNLERCRKSGAYVENCWITTDENGKAKYITTAEAQAIFGVTPLPTFTEGSILFSDVSGVPTEDNDTFYFSDEYILFGNYPYNRLDTSYQLNWMYTDSAGKLQTKPRMLISDGSNYTYPNNPFPENPKHGDLFQITMYDGRLTDGWYEWNKDAYEVNDVYIGCWQSLQTYQLEFSSDTLHKVGTVMDVGINKYHPSEHYQKTPINFNSSDQTRKILLMGYAIDAYKVSGGYDYVSISNGSSALDDFTVPFTGISIVDCISGGCWERKSYIGIFNRIMPSLPYNCIILQSDIEDPDPEYQDINVIIYYKIAYTE